MWVWQAKLKCEGYLAWMGGARNRQCVRKLDLFARASEMVQISSSVGSAITRN